MTPQWWESVAYHALGYRETLEATFDICRATLAHGIEGDFVECGVFAGSHCAVMAKAIMLQREGRPWEPERKVHIFDSFQGLPAATEVDQEIWAHHGAKTGEASCSIEQVRLNMQSWGIPESLLVYHVGWFEDTVARAIQAERNSSESVSKIALLRLDGDLYGSTKACMQFYPLVSHGGWCIVDDWNLTGCRQAVQEIVVPAPIYFRKPTK